MTERETKNRALSWDSMQLHGLQTDQAHLAWAEEEHLCISILNVN